MKKLFFTCLPLMMVLNVSANTKDDKWKPIYERKKFDNIMYSADKNKTKKEVKPVAIPLAVENSKVDEKTDSAIQDLSTPMSIQPKNSLEQLFADKSGSKDQLAKIKASVFNLKNKAVPTLINVMKSADYPEKSRWWATFLLVKVMGTKAEAFVAKFYKHPAYFMRLASLKALNHLKNTKYKGLYALALKDDSMIVRLQALQNINDLKLTDMAPSVWNMLYDKSNYNGDMGKLKRGSLIRLAIKTLGDLGFGESKKAMLQMISSKKFEDVHVELDYALEKLTGKKSPSGEFTQKAHFWSRLNLANTSIE